MSYLSIYSHLPEVHTDKNCGTHLQINQQLITREKP